MVLVWSSRILPALLVMLVACTKANPAATCADGTCIDPAFPFCDVDGEIGGAAGTCIAVTCDAGVIGGCEGSAELVCSATGATYVTRSCANGCDPIAGCLECVPNGSVCTGDGNFQTCDANGSATTTVCPHVCDPTVGCRDCVPSSVTCTEDGSSVQTCDDSGLVASTQPCSLACGSDGGAHCEALVPSNGLETFLDLVTSPSDVVLEDGLLDLGSDFVKFFPRSGSAFTLPAFQLPAPADGSPITVIVGRKITLGKLVIENADPTVSGGVGHAVAFVATDELDVNDTVSVETGAIDIPTCSGGNGAEDRSGAEPHTAGGGGGANATNGASGGNVVLPAVTGGTAGVAAGNDTLIPLKGGCPGGLGGSTTAQYFGGSGGGAIQLVSLRSIQVSAAIVADGDLRAGGGFTTGGGAGGSILIEAPAISLTSAATLLARGGGGDSGYGQVGVSPNDGSPIPGGTCTSGQTSTCSNGGHGATLSSDAAPGANIAMSKSGDDSKAGGGGGGVGRIRINTKDGSVTQANGALIAGRLTTGRVATR